MGTQVIPPPPDAGGIPSPPDYAPPKADDRGVVGGALADTFGMTDRPGAKSILKPGTPGYQTPLDVFLRPGQSGSEFPGQETFERFASAAMSAAPILKAGTVAGKVAAKVAPSIAKTIAPAAGRVAASGAKGAAEGAYADESSPGAGWGALIDAAVAAGTEAVGAGLAGNLPYVGVGLKKAGAGVRGFEAATAAPGKALEMIRDRVAQMTGGNQNAISTIRSLEIPAMGPGKWTVEDAVTKLATMTDAPYRLARAQLIRQLNKFDKLALPADVNPRAGAIFKEVSGKAGGAERFNPKLGAKVAEGTRRTVLGEPGRALADAAGTQEYEGIPLAIPAGAAVGSAVLSAPLSFGQAASRLMR